MVAVELKLSGLGTNGHWQSGSVKNAIQRKQLKEYLRYLRKRQHMSNNNKRKIRRNFHYASMPYCSSSLKYPKCSLMNPFPSCGCTAFEMESSFHCASRITTWTLQTTEFHKLTIGVKFHKFDGIIHHFSSFDSEVHSTFYC